MEAQTDHELDRSSPADDEVLSALVSPRIEEPSFLVLESGHVRFFVRPRVEVVVPRSIDDVQRLALTLAPRNRAYVRRIAVGRKRLPGDGARERHWACVDRVGTPDEILSDLGPREYETKTRGLRRQAGSIEIAFGTYAIALHRRHAHLMYELDEEGSLASSSLLRQLGIGRRASYVAAVFASGPRRFTPLVPELLEREGTELVLIGGGRSEVDDAYEPRS